MYEYLLEFNALSVVLRILVTCICGGLIGLEREKNRRPAGLRTHLIVSIGACVTSMSGAFAAQIVGLNVDATRIAASVISGVGFLGVGTIFVKDHDHITGLTTAAGLWATSAIGVASGFAMYEGAILSTFVIVVVTAILNRFEKSKKERYTSKSFYLELNSPEIVNEVSDWLIDEFNSKDIVISAPRSGKTGNVGMEVRIPIIPQGECTATPNDFIKKEGVVFSVENVSTIGRR